MKAGHNISCFIYIQKWGCDVQVHAEETVWAADFLRLWTWCKTEASSRGTSHFYANHKWWEDMKRGSGKGKLWDKVEALHKATERRIKWLHSLYLVWLWHFMDRTSAQLFIAPKLSVNNQQWNWSGHRVGTGMQDMCTDNCIKDSTTADGVFDLQ